MAELSQKINEVIERSVVSFSKSVPTDAIQKNIDFEMRAGMRPRIVRSTDGHCCAWCSAIAGEYYADEAPADIYRRHDNCSCTVTYISEKGYQDAHTKKWIDRQELEVRRSRIANDKRSRLSANNEDNDIPEHDPPIYLTTIDYQDKEAVRAILQSFEDEVADLDHEEALVITRDGKVYRCFGDKANVYPNADLGDEAIIGASISHNHPADVTEYTFSGDDLALFEKYHLDVLRGKDVKYTYQLSSSDTSVDGYPVEWQTEENFHHCQMILAANSRRIGYRRWLND